jgi:hypothetical protein
MVKVLQMLVVLVAVLVDSKVAVDKVAETTLQL